MVSHGPCQPTRIEIPAAPALAIIIGTRNGEIRSAPLLEEDADLLLERLEAADAGGEDHAGAVGVGADARRRRRAAMSAAATENWAKRSTRRTSLGPNQAVGSKSGTRRVPSGAGRVQPVPEGVEPDAAARRRRPCR